MHNRALAQWRVTYFLLTFVLRFNLFTKLNICTYNSPLRQDLKRYNQKIKMSLTYTMTSKKALTLLSINLPLTNLHIFFDLIIDRGFTWNKKTSYSEES